MRNFCIPDGFLRDLLSTHGLSAPGVAVEARWIIKLTDLWVERLLAFHFGLIEIDDERSAVLEHTPSHFS